MWFMIAMAAIAAIGAISKSGAESAAAKATDEAASRNSQLANQAAADAVKRSDLDAMRIQARGASIIASQKAETSTGGIDANTGSSADIAQQTKVFTDMDLMIIQNDASRAAYGLRTKSQQILMQGSYDSAIMRNAAQADWLSGLGKAAGAIGGQAMDRGSESFDWPAGPPPPPPGN